MARLQDPFIKDALRSFVEQPRTEFVEKPAARATTTRNLAPYRERVGTARQMLNKHLAGGRSDASTIAQARRTLEIMEAQLRDNPDYVLGFEQLPPDRRYGLRGADLWLLRCQERAATELLPEQADPDTYERKYQEYLDLRSKLMQQVDMQPRLVVDQYTGRSYLYQENPLVLRVMKIIGDELMVWFSQHEMDAGFYRMSAREGLAQMLSERPDVLALLRMAQKLPLDTEISEVSIQRPTIVEAVELAIALVPVVGSAVAVYEAYTGQDLFGYQLTDLERGILAASVLLPLAGRLVKGGRAIYTESRMIALYGRDARGWSRAFAAGERVTAEGRILQTLERAEATVRAHQTLDRQLATDAASVLTHLTQSGGAASTAVDQAVTDLFQRLSSRHAILRDLDALAIQRVLEKGPNVDHLKAQLLEELIESRLVPWLQKRTGPVALGVSAPGKQLEFFPGHLIRDASGRQITDGIIGYRNNGVLEIVAIFEAKAGRRAARELSMTSGSIKSLSQAEKLELRAYAKDVLRTERELARLQGRPFNRRVEDIEHEIIQTEIGGQVQRDIERLDELADGTLMRINIGAQNMPVRFSRSRTKFFGVLPKDVNRSLIERELAAQNVNFEIIGVDLSEQDLRSIAKEMVPLATTMAKSP